MSLLGGRVMTEMEPFPFFQDDTTATSAAMDDLLLWDFFQQRGYSDPLSPAVFDRSPLLPREDMQILSWGTSLPEEQPTPLGHPLPAPGGELLGWVSLPMAEPSARVTPVLDPPRQSQPPGSAFARYERSCYYGECRTSSAGGGGGRSVHMRVIELLRRMPAEKKEAKGSRGFRHMMRERQRRERLSQNYADLHSLIVPRPKANKNSIVLAAVAYVRELKGAWESVQRRHQELRGMAAGGAGTPVGARIKLRVGNPSSPVDSMIAAFRQLKTMGVTVASVRSSAASPELSAVIDVQTKMATTEVEKAVQGALVEVEWRLRGGSDPDPR